jgi:long-subunit fatty acid transport protein
MIQKGSARGRRLLVLSAIAFMSGLLPMRQTRADSTAEIIRDIRVPSRINPVGSGARALGMGSAFVAVADDATAASWNPGGLIQLDRAEISIVGDVISRTDVLTFGNNPEANSSQVIAESKLNYFSIAYPFVFLQRNMVVSLNYQRLYDFDLEWEYPRSLSDTDVTVNQWIKNRQEGDLYAIGLAYSAKILPNLSFGFTLNFWENLFQDNGWRETTTQTSMTVITDPESGEEFVIASETSLSEEYTFSGFNFNIGLLWSVTEKLTIGAVFKSPFTADLMVDGALSFNDSPGSTQLPSTVPIEDSLGLSMPMSYALGIAYKFADPFIMSVDFTRTHWEDFVLKNGSEISPITTLPKDGSDIDPTNQLRVGAEYLIIKPTYVIPLRGGLFYDPAPARNSPDDYYGFSLGTGISINRFSLDAAYQYRFGNDVGKSKPTQSDLSVDVDEHALYCSAIVYF